jgi:hypothetical protein
MTSIHKLIAIAIICWTLMMVALVIGGVIESKQEECPCDQEEQVEE